MNENKEEVIASAPPCYDPPVYDPLIYNQNDNQKYIVYIQSKLFNNNYYVDYIEDTTFNYIWYCKSDLSIRNLTKNQAIDMYNYII